MMHNMPGLYDMLNAHNAELDRQIIALKERLYKKIEAMPYPDQTTIYDLESADGAPALSSLLAAKAQVLSGMAALKAADMRGKKPGGW